MLARRANALRREESLAGWLHGVAVRVCLNQRKALRRRRRREQEAADMVEQTVRPQELDELKQLIDEELAALPGKLREVSAHDLEGATAGRSAGRAPVTPYRPRDPGRDDHKRMGRNITGHGAQAAAGNLQPGSADGDRRIDPHDRDERHIFSHSARRPRKPGWEQRSVHSLREFYTP